MDPFTPPDAALGSPDDEFAEVGARELSAGALFALTGRAIARRPISLVMVTFWPWAMVSLFNELTWFSMDTLLGPLGLLVYGVGTSVGMLATIAVAILVDDLVSERPFDDDRLLSCTAKRWVPVVLTDVFATVLFGLGFLMLILPGLWLVLVMWFVPFVVTLRGEAGADAIRRSSDLFNGRFWSVTGRVLLIVTLHLPSTVGSFVVAVTELETAVAVIADGIIAVLAMPVDVASVLLFLNLDANPVVIADDKTAAGLTP